MRIKYVLAVALLGLGFARPVKASPLFETLAGFGGQGGLQPRHTGPSMTSAYFNPALLPDAPMASTTGFLVLNASIGIGLDPRMSSANIADMSTYNTVSVGGGTGDRNRLPFYPVPTDWLNNGHSDPVQPNVQTVAPRPRQHAGTGHQTNTYFSIGAVLKAFKDRVGLGVYTLIPNVNFTTFNTFYANEKEQFATNSLHPELYDDRLKSLSVATSLGARITDSLSIGLGVTIGIVAPAGAKAYVADSSNLTALDLNIKANAKVKLIPHVGLAWNPTKRLHLTGTLHAPQKIDIKAGFSFLLATGSEQSSGLGFTLGFNPWQAGLGVGYDIIQTKDLVVNATASALYGRWSQYINRQSIRPDGAYEWNDTITGAAGVRVQSGGFSIAFDGEYKPTPVPLQTGRYNYVDNNRLGAALSISYAFEAAEQKMAFGLSFQGYRMLERHQTKLPTPTYADGVNRTPQLVTDEIPDDATNNREPFPGREGLQTNNPGWPGFKSAGWISSAGLYLTVML